MAFTFTHAMRPARLATAALAVLVLLAGSVSGVPAAPAYSREAAGAGTSALAVPEGMVRIPAGVYQPLYRPLKRNAEGVLVEVENVGEAVPAFFLDATPVTNADYLAFVRADPRWQRSRLLRAFADAGYLAHWQGDLEPGAPAPGRAPVVGVSWYAASAYCAWRGKALPTTAQWEYVADASETAANGRADPDFSRRILEWYSRPAPAVLPPVGSVFRNLWGVYDLHGLVWEWTADFTFTLDRGESGGVAKRQALTCGAGAIGAVDATDYAAFMRFAFRSSLRADYAVGSLGFRCAQTAP